jgi:hypothetical protein
MGIELAETAVQIPQDRTHQLSNLPQWVPRGDTLLRSKVGKKPSLILKLTTHRPKTLHIARLGEHLEHV